MDEDSPTLKGSAKIVHSENRGWLAVDIPAGKFEKMFKAELFEHEHTKSEHFKVGCSQYSIPRHLQSAVDYITPGVKLYATQGKRPSYNDIEKRTFGFGAISPTPPKTQALPESLTDLLKLLCPSPARKRGAVLRAEHFPWIFESQMQRTRF